MHIFYGIFIMLHGLVHFWYVTLSQEWVEFQPDMGWTGQSWLLSGLFGPTTNRTLAATGYTLAALLLVVGGIGVLANAEWTGSLLLPAAIVSAIVILVFWDGGMRMLVQKGLLGLLINLGIIGVLTFLR